MPFMWSSPGPFPADFTLMPVKTRSLLWKGASGCRMGDSLKLVSEPVGAHEPLIVPFAVKTTTRRVGGVAPAASR